MSCLDQYLSLGNWFCTSCTKKRLQFGLHHIVDGIESVWDVKAEGKQRTNTKILRETKSKFILAVLPSIS